MHHSNPRARVTRFVSAPGRWLGLSIGALVACTPTVQVQPPREPITINLNIKLDADVRVKLEQQAKEDVASKPIF